MGEVVGDVVGEVVGLVVGLVVGDVVGEVVGDVVGVVVGVGDSVGVLEVFTEGDSNCTGLQAARPNITIGNKAFLCRDKNILPFPLWPRIAQEATSSQNLPSPVWV